MISALLVDDEIEANNGLNSLIKIFCHDVQVLAMGTTIQNSVQLIQNLKPQLIFLDVEMADGTGFDILEKITELNFVTIFVTAFDHYAIRALRFNALDYLLKPVDPDELVAAVDRAREKIKNNLYPEYSHVINDHRTQDFNKVGISTANGIQYIQLSDIVRLESSNNYTFIHTANDKPILISKTIKSFEKTLPGERFIRCHQRHMVNIDYVSGVIKSEKGNFIIIKDIHIPISRSHKYYVLGILKTRHKII